MSESSVNQLCASASIGHRTAASEVLPALLEARQHFGITRIADISGLDDDLGVYVHSVVRPRSCSTTTVHSGRGLTAPESLVSALAEAIEVDSAERFALRCDSMDDSGTMAPERVSRFQSRGAAGSETEVSAGVACCWGVDLEYPVERIRVPLSLVQQGASREPGGSPQLSSGLGSGTVWEEAVLHGLLELVERDAVAIFAFRARLASVTLAREYPRIRPEDLPFAAQRIVSRVLDARRAVGVIDISVDTALPVCLATIDGCCGAAAGLTPEDAALRALTEAAQTSTVNKQGTREDLLPEGRDTRIHPRSPERRLRSVQNLFSPTRSVTTVPDEMFRCGASCARSAVEHVLERIQRAAGGGVYAVDVTDTACPVLKVARVLAPRLEAYRWDVVGPRRLRYWL